MKKATLLLLFLGIISPLFTFSCFSQKQHPLLPVSSTAASLGKYGDIDVSLVTGQINPSVKLLNIQLNDFTFPVNLSYASSGLKVHEIPASVGMGMSISGTSAITRQVRSVPDEQTHGYNGLNPTASVVQSINAGSYTATTAYQSYTEAQFKRKIGETDFDSEPDLFNFSCPSGGGKFFFDETQTNSPDKLAILPKQPLRIVGHFNYNASGQLFNSANQSGRIESFDITDGKGIKYTFNKQEGALLDDDAYQFGKNIVSTWYLSKIETPNGNSLDFTYIQRTIDQPHAQSEYRYLYDGSYPNLDNGVHKTVSESTTTETVLQEILINGGTWGKIEFVEDVNNREDWAFSLSGTKPKSLKEVRLKDGQGSLVRKYEFNYVAGAGRLLLRSVQEYGPTGTSNEPTTFEYYSESSIPSLPSNNSNVISREDHFGYYNANTTESLLPDYQVVQTSSAGISRTYTALEFDAHLDSLKRLAVDIKELSSKNPQNVQVSYAYFVTATNRIPDFNSALIGQLKKITYPTKAYSEFIYESNSYYGRNDEVFNPCSGNFTSIGLATKTFSSNSLCPPHTTTSFSVAEGAFSCMKVVWSINLNSPNQDVIDGEVFIINDATGGIYSPHTLSCNNGATVSDGASSYVVLPPGNYTAHASLCREVPGNNSSVATIDVQAIPVVVGSIYSTRTSGGVRIKEVKDCPNGNANDCLIKEYAYTAENDPTQSSGRIVTNGKYIYPVQYFTTENGGNTVSANYLNSASQLPLSTTFGQYIGYNTVIVKSAKIVDGNRVYNGKTVYDYRSPDENEEPDINAGTYPFWSISNDWKRGVVERMKMYDESGVWVKDEQNSYVLKPSLSYSKYTSIKSGKFIHNLEVSPLGYDPNMYNFSKYQSISGFQYNQQVSSKEQFNNVGNLSNIERITQYFYDNDSHLQLTHVNSTNSKGESLITQYKYPNDITSGDLQPSASLLSSRKSELLQTETFLNSLSIAKTQNFYSDFGGKALPSSQKTFIGGNSIAATESLQLGYDSYGNLTSFKEAGGATSSFLWGYNGQYPVVYIANGTPPDNSVLLTSFNASTIESTANTLRGNLPNAQVSSYTFKPMVGMLSNTAPNLLKTSFVFDGLNRLDKILDHENNIIKAYQYQYASSLGGDNFVKELMPRIAGTSLPSGYENLQTVISYIDGLGRPLQTVAQQAGTGGTNDIVSNAVTYDGYSRIAKSYIPFPNVGSGALANLPSSVHGDSRPFTENLTYDNSPLNRLLTVRGVGDAWLSANKYSESKIEVSGGLRSYSVSAGSVSSSTYPANSLYKKTSIDEQGNTSIEYSDKEGRLIQKEQQLDASTYAKTAYIYNDLGQLAFIVQPESYDNATAFNKNSAIFSLGIFGYEYDAKGRVINSHVPSGGWTAHVFDLLHREIASQDEQQAANANWAYKKYDAFGRLIMTGLRTIGIGRQDLQNAIDGLPNQYEERATVGTGLMSYTNQSGMYAEASTLQVVNYFDDYAPFASDNVGFAGSFETQYTNAKGLATGNKTKNQLTNDWISSVQYYNSKNRPIQYQSRFGSSTTVTYIGGDIAYDFSGNAQKNYEVTLRTGQANIFTKKETTYDHQSRPLLQKHAIGVNGATPLITIASNAYDQVGRLLQKKIRPDESFFTGGAKDYIIRPTTNGAVTQNNTEDIARKAVILLPTTDIKAITLNTYKAQIDPNAPQGTPISSLQTIDFLHHIRGGLLGINLNSSKNPIPNAAQGDLFSYKLEYETAGFYDGNIGKQTWQTTENNSPLGLRSFTYGYDASSRLKSATYAGIDGENFSMPNLNYDKNGNIANLQRNGKNGSAFGAIDNLGYNYSGNRLLGVSDAINGNENVGDFRDNGTNNDFTYWADGSLKSDANKGISLIEYDDFLKRVKKVSWSNGNWITFFYSGDGKLIKRSNSLGDYWEYYGSVVYKNGLPYQASMPEGRAVYVAGVWVYEYEYRDHQNNLRVAFKADGNQLVQTQTNETDPFGLTIQPLSSTGATLQNYRFQNQEKIEDFGLNLNWFKYRPEDPTYGRMWQVDELAHKYVHNSTYAFSENKVTNHIELDGLEAVPAKKPNDINNSVNSAGMNAKISPGLAAGAEVSPLGFKFGAFINLSTIDAVSSQIDAVQGVSLLKVATPKDYTQSVGIDGGVGLVGGSYGVERNFTTDDNGIEKIKEKTTTELNFGPVSYITSTFQELDTKTHKPIPETTTTSTGFSVFKSEVKVGLGFKAEAKATYTVELSGSAVPKRPLGITPSDATRVNNNLLILK
jgi:hypothetical protein